MLISRFL